VGGKHGVQTLQLGSRGGGALGRVEHRRVILLICPWRDVCSKGEGGIINNAWRGEERRGEERRGEEERS
jgi:hypothetical protein